MSWEGVSVGRGAVVDADDGVLFSDFAELTFKFGLKGVEVPRGQLGGGSYQIATGQDFGAKVGCHAVSAGILAALTGGSITAIATALRPVFIEEEEVTVTGGTPPTSTLAQTPSTAGAVTIRLSDGTVLAQVATTPVKDKSYTIAGNTVTWATSQTGPVYASYFYNLSTGDLLQIDPDDLPQKFKFYGTLRLQGRADTPDYMTGVFNKVIRAPGEVSVGAGRDGHNPLEFDVNIENRFPGDVKFYFPA